MSIDVSEKLKLIRESERLNRKEFSELTGVAYSSLSSYESRSKNAGVEAIMKVLQHPRFTKYTLWFMTDQLVYSPETFSHGAKWVTFLGPDGEHLEINEVL